jgi:hypothetical protein
MQLLALLKQEPTPVIKADANPDINRLQAPLDSLTASLGDGRIRYGRRYAVWTR